MQALEVCLISVTFKACQTCLIGYPPSPPDDKVCDFLTKDNPAINVEDASSRVGNFFLALFEEVAESLKESKFGNDQLTQIEMFHKFMSKD